MQCRAGLLSYRRPEELLRSSPRLWRASAELIQGGRAADLSGFWGSGSGSRAVAVARVVGSGTRGKSRGSRLARVSSCRQITGRSLGGGVRMPPIQARQARLQPRPVQMPDASQERVDEQPGCRGRARGILLVRVSCALSCEPACRAVWQDPSRWRSSWPNGSAEFSQPELHPRRRAPLAFLSGRSAGEFWRPRATSWQSSGECQATVRQPSGDWLSSSGEQRSSASLGAARLQECGLCSGDSRPRPGRAPSGG